MKPIIAIPDLRVRFPLVILSTSSANFIRAREELSLSGLHPSRNETRGETCS